MSAEHGRLVDADSLGATLDAINESLFFVKPISQRDKTAAASWIAARQGSPGAYAGMFAPTALDFQRGVAVFTGESVRSRAATSHILGEEACRALRLLGALPAKAAQALARAEDGMATRLHGSRDESLGRYCCATCTCAVWRNMLSGGLQPSEQFIASGLQQLASRRDGKGRWQGYPYYYTLLSLLEMAQPSALAELRYAAPGCERLLNRRQAAATAYAQRRAAVAKQVLARC
jgi:hypothetical protein